MADCNTPKYWDTTWSRWRHADKVSYLSAQLTRAITPEYWTDAFHNPVAGEKYSVQRAWWHAKRLNPRSVLDVGCGNGRLLYGMKLLLSDTAELLGVDYSPVGIARMEKEYGVPGKVLDVFQLDSLERKFDFIVVNDVLEHLADEVGFLQTCARRLSDRGILYIAFPNNVLDSDETDEHLRTYNPQSALQLMEKVFKRVELELIDIHILCTASAEKTK